MDGGRLSAQDPASLPDPRLQGLRWLGHSAVLVQRRQTLYFDPYRLPEGLPKADVILLTHSHYDHCSPADVAKIAKPETLLVGPADAVAGFAGEKLTLAAGGQAEARGLRITALPAYNAIKPYHPKSKGWLGFLVELADGFRVYHAGDTDQMDEVGEIRPDVAFFPVDALFTMSGADGAKAAAKVRPGLSIPIHYGSVCGRREEAGAFARKCRESGLSAHLLEESR